MERIHSETRSHQNKVQPGGPLHPVLADAQLQIEDKTSKEKPRPREVSADLHQVRKREINALAG